MVQGSMSCIKYLMFLFNFFFVVCGLALIVVGGIVLGKDYAHFADGKYIGGPIFLILVGVVIFFIAFLGCCGAIKESHCMVMMFGVLMFIIFIVELAVGITAYVHRSELKGIIKDNMITSLENQTDLNFWNDMQHSLECCGVDSVDDYVKNYIPIPESCCPDEAVAGHKCPVDKAYKQGCYKVVFGNLWGIIGLLGAVAIGLGVVELLGCLFACCLASAIKRDYDGV